MTDVQSNPELYRQLSAPFESSDAANEAIRAFVTDLRELRERHRIRDVHVIISADVIYGEREGTVITDAHYGDSLRAEQMLAWALGREQAEHKEFIAKLLATKRVPA